MRAVTVCAVALLIALAGCRRIDDTTNTQRATVVQQRVDDGSQYIAICIEGYKFIRGYRTADTGLTQVIDSRGYGIPCY